MSLHFERINENFRRAAEQLSRVSIDSPDGNDLRKGVTAALSVYCMKTWIVIILLGALSGCNSVGEVVPTGKSSYMVSVKGCDGQLLFSASCSTTGIKAANEYCQRKGLVATIAHFDETQQWGSPQHGTVQFYCSDEAHQQDTVLRPDKGVETIQQR